MGRANPITRTGTIHKYSVLVDRKEQEEIRWNYLCGLFGHDLCVQVLVRFVSIYGVPDGSTSNANHLDVPPLDIAAISGRNKVRVTGRCGILQCGGQLRLGELRVERL